MTKLKTLVPKVDLSCLREELEKILINLADLEDLADLREDLEEIKNGLEASKLPVINGDEQLKEVIEALKCNDVIEWLDMSYSYNISDKGIRAFAEYLKNNKTITFLKLDGNGITNQGGTFLAEAIRNNHTLKELSLLFNEELGKEGKEDLIRAMKESKSLACIKFNAEEEIVDNTKERYYI